MRSLPLALLSLSLLAAPAARAHDHDDLPCSIDVGPMLEGPARWAPRHEARGARFAITTEDGKVDLLLTSTAVAFQLSDRSMRRVDRELNAKLEEDEDNALGSAIKTAVISGVRVLLNHSAECPLRELRDVDYRDGELVFETRDGDTLFDHIQMDDENLLGAFRERDARAFVREFRRARANDR